MAGPNMPITFCDVEGKESSEKKADRNIALQSKSNEMEADCMVRVNLHACCKHSENYPMLVIWLKLYSLLRLEVKSLATRLLSTP